MIGQQFDPQFSIAPATQSRSGVVARLGVPGQYRVQMMTPKGVITAETVSASDTGVYTLHWLASLPSGPYIILAYDHSPEPVNAAIVDLRATFGQAGLDLGAASGIAVINAGPGELRGTVRTDTADKSASVRVYRADTHVWSRSVTADADSGYFRVTGLDPAVDHYALIIPRDPTQRPYFWGPNAPRVP